MRAVVATAQAAAEERDVAAIMDLVSARYEDADGRGAAELARTLRGYFLAYRSAHLVARVETVEFPYRDQAKLRLTVGTLGRRATPSDAISIAANVHEVTLELQREGDRWKVTRAEWQPLVSARGSPAVRKESRVVACSSARRRARR